MSDAFISLLPAPTANPLIPQQQLVDLQIYGLSTKGEILLLLSDFSGSEIQN